MMHRRAALRCVNFVAMSMLGMTAPALAADKPEKYETAAAQTEQSQPGDRGAYLSLYFLSVFPKDKNVRVGEDQIPQTSVGAGFGGGIKGGHFFPQTNGVLGFEAELFGHTFSTTAPRTMTAGQTRFTDTNFHSINYMLNGLVRYPGTIVQPYVGIGGGVSTGYMNEGPTQAGGLRLLGEARTTTWAYQFIGGMRLVMTPRWFVFSEYRYFRADYDWGIQNSGLHHSLQFQAHHAVFGVGARF